MPQANVITDTEKYSQLSAFAVILLSHCTHG